MSAFAVNVGGGAVIGATDIGARRLRQIISTTTIDD
jgi:hypothetical protein